MSDETEIGSAFVISLNRGACERGGAQHGLNRETQEAAATEWAEKQRAALSLSEVLDFLRYCHCRSPFLFFSGNTFADIGRQLVSALFAELATGRRREVMSAVGHYIAGVLDREAMVEIVETLSRSADFKPGDHVKTLGGSTHGKVLHVLENGCVVWQPDGSTAELTGLPESLTPEE
jgi:hypothetical protein